MYAAEAVEKINVAAKCLCTRITLSHALKAKFHYAIWFEAGRRLAAS